MSEEAYEPELREAYIEMSFFESIDTWIKGLGMKAVKAGFKSVEMKKQGKDVVSIDAFVRVMTSCAQEVSKIQEMFMLFREWAEAKHHFDEKLEAWGKDKNDPEFQAILDFMNANDPTMKALDALITESPEQQQERKNKELTDAMIQAVINTPLKGES